MMTGKILSDAEINKLRELASNITITECSIKKEFVNQIIGTIDELKRESRDEQLARQEIEKRLKDQCRETNRQAARAEQAEAALGTPEVYTGVVSEQLARDYEKAIHRLCEEKRKCGEVEQKCERMEKVVEAARYMPLKTKVGVSCSDAASYTIKNGTIWELGKALSQLDAHPTEQAEDEQIPTTGVNAMWGKFPEGGELSGEKPTADEPEACPWCGSEAAVDEEHPNRVWVGCDGAGCLVCGPERRTREQAIAAWNRIAAPKPTKSEDKVLQELRDEASRKQMDAKDPLTEAFWRQVQSWIDKQRNRIVKEADNGLG